jgi:hypothetical protein
LAWARVRADISDRVFVRPPFEVELVEVDLASWLEALRKAIASDIYRPSPMLVCDVPKARGGIRPGSHLVITDRVIYAACVGACLPQILRTIEWSQGKVDFAYQLSADTTQRRWLRSQFAGWQDFRAQSLAALDKGYSYVVIADISAFFDNIDLATLVSDLKQIKADDTVVQQLSGCLNRWCLMQGRGIPQGQSASDILAKLYLNSIDANLQAMGYVHLRYVDDFRIFCKSKVEAKKALADLTRLLRKRGPYSQGTKSDIHRADEARALIEGVLPELNRVARQFVAEIVRTSGLGDPYLSVPEAETILLQNPSDAPLDLIRDAYKAYFIDSADTTFNHTLFRFLLNRLGKSEDDFAVGHCLSMFERHPEETHTVLEYFAAVEAISNIEKDLLAFLTSEEALYPYQVYQIVEWLNEEAADPSQELVAVVRRLTFDNAQPAYVRAVARQFIGVFGTTADLERLEASYAEIGNSMEQAQIMCSLLRMERQRRNAFLGRAAGDGEWNRRGAEWIKRQLNA